MPPIVQRLITVLTAVAFMLAMSVQAIPSAEALGLTSVAKAADMDEHCPRMAAEHPDRGMPQLMPCKGIMPDCVKQIGCIGSPNVPSRSAEMQRRVSYTTVIYWSPAEERTGLSVEPDLVPPIAS
jgi:hypothetical protein